MKKELCLISILLLSIETNAQKLSKTYDSLITAAYAQYNAKYYQKAADTYTEAFKSQGWIGNYNDRYNAACSWAKAGNADSAFFQLERIATKVQYAEYNQLRIDRDLESLHKDRRWQPLVDLVKKNKDEKQKGMDRDLIAMLDSVYVEDQQYRMMGEETFKKYGMEAKETQDLIKLVGEKDSINLIKVCAILDKHGWLGGSKIGAEANNTLFLVIQHADLKVQQKYLPMMREALKKGNAYATQLALLEDRVAIGEGRKQSYGSQIGMDKVTGAYYVEPLDDPDNVDKRRAKMGLQPMQEYLNHWQLKWDVAAYKSAAEKGTKEPGR